MSEPTTETPAAGTAATAVIDAPEGKTFSAEAMHRARQEAAAARAELAEIKKAREAEEAAKLADEKKWQDLYTAEQKKREKAEAAVTASEARVRARLAKSELKSAAVAAGIQDTDDIDLIKADELITLESDEEIAEAAKELVKKFKAAKPHKFQKLAEKAEEPLPGTPVVKKPAPKSTATPNGEAKTDPRTFSLKDKASRDEMLAAWETVGRA